MSTVHRIAEVRFAHGIPGEDAPLTCYCGWQGQAGDFSAHRNEMGARVKNPPPRGIPWSQKEARA